MTFFNQPGSSLLIQVLSLLSSTLSFDWRRRFEQLHFSHHTSPELTGGTSIIAVLRIEDLITNENEGWFVSSFFCLLVSSQVITENQN